MIAYEFFVHRRRAVEGAGADADRHDRGVEGFAGFAGRVPGGLRALICQCWSRPREAQFSRKGPTSRGRHEGRGVVAAGDPCAKERSTRSGRLTRSTRGDDPEGQWPASRDGTLLLEVSSHEENRPARNRRNRPTRTESDSSIMQTLSDDTPMNSPTPSPSTDEGTERRD